MPITVLGARDTATNKTAKVPAVMELLSVISESILL